MSAQKGVAGMNKAGQSERELIARLKKRRLADKLRERFVLKELFKKKTITVLFMLLALVVVVLLIVFRQSWPEYPSVGEP